LARSVSEMSSAEKAARILEIIAESNGSKTHREATA